MIECLLDGHKDIWYNAKLYAIHILRDHHKKDVPKELWRWAEKY